MEDLKLFQSPEFGQVRTVVKNGEVLFAATDVAKCLGYVNPRDAVAKHCKSAGVAKCDVGVQTGSKSDGTPSIQNVKNVIHHQRQRNPPCCQFHPSASREDRKLDFR